MCVMNLGQSSPAVVPVPHVHVSLQLLLLNEAALVLVDDFKGLLDVLSRLARHAACTEELLVVESASL